MNILITNDDGIKAKGIQVLAKTLGKYNNITVVAPDSQKSASSHSITLTNSIILKEERIEGVNGICYSVSGTPADCTKLAITTIINKNVDIVISGINDGFNLGTDVLYSGTVSAAIEGAINKVPAIAISCDGTDESYEIATECVKKIIEKLEWNTLGNLVLNVNIPSVKKNELKGLRVCGIGERSYNNVYIEIEKDSGKSVYKISGELEPTKEIDTDVAFIKEGYITVTPLHYDLTNFKHIEQIKELLL